MALRPAVLPGGAQVGAGALGVAVGAAARVDRSEHRAGAGVRRVARGVAARDLLGRAVAGVGAEEPALAGGVLRARGAGGRAVLELARAARAQHDPAVAAVGGAAVAGALGLAGRQRRDAEVGAGDLVGAVEEAVVVRADGGAVDVVHLA